MKKLLLTLLLLATIATSAIAADRALVFLIRKTDWDSIPANVKQQGKEILQNCTDAPIPLGWSWNLRSKANTNVVWGYAVFSKDAWALKRGIGQIDEAKIQQIRDKWDSYGGVIRWTTNFWADVEASGLERIPTEDE